MSVQLRHDALQVPDLSLDSTELNDDDEFIVSLLSSIEDDLVSLADTMCDDGLCSYAEPLITPSDVLDVDDDLPSAAKRQKLCKLDRFERTPPLPLPAKQPMRKLPVCIFLNFMGTREPICTPKVPNKTVSEPARCIPSGFVHPTDDLVATPKILFPVCPCKMKHLCFTKEKDAISPPILQLLAMCSTIATNTKPLLGTVTSNRAYNDEESANEVTDNDNSLVDEQDGVDESASASYSC